MARQGKEPEAGNVKMVNWSRFNGVGRRYQFQNYEDDKLQVACRALMELEAFELVARKVGVIWHIASGLVVNLSNGQQADQGDVSEYCYELWMDSGCREILEHHGITLTDTVTGKPAVRVGEEDLGIDITCLARVRDDQVTRECKP